ncbi:MAG: alpha-galactosidase [Ignavibacteriae bacterium]|nr:alpha-galactosidase [Ignavibacteriota bacterium]
MITRLSIIFLLCVLCIPRAAAQRIVTAQRDEGARTVLTLANDKVECSVVLENGRLVLDRLVARPDWAHGFGTSPVAVETDGDFAAEIMWTDWQAPKSEQNAENPVTLTKSDFTVRAVSFQPDTDGSMELWLDMACVHRPMHLRLTYRLRDNDFVLRRKVTLRDSSGRGHFLQYLATRDGAVAGRAKIVKDGGFGQPAALQSLDGAAFFGLEYPAAETRLTQTGQRLRLLSRQEAGEKITAAGFEGAWAVSAAVPDYAVKRWFMEYVREIRVADPRPYLLYNSWYDLRSTEYPRVPAENRMNEANVLRIATRLRETLIEKHGIPLDAFVLDDGWDDYASDWVLRAREFPNGLDPIMKELDKSGTRLGLWFGPTGGYSFRSRRIEWMKNHGYEVTSAGTRDAMLCIAGKKYSELLGTRLRNALDAVGARYFKLDGFQFSCSEADHGHAAGIYSRRAGVQSVFSLARAARETRPDVYLNITSGTWLSPWWLLAANQIWMQGEDHAYADVPSLQQRDAAITYRDRTLYEGLRKQDNWFPMENLMTHGIIKGTLESGGGDSEPIESFNNEVMMYLARGVSMWELYISPDRLSEPEWDVLAAALRWARDRFPVLSTTEMIGGDPGRREAYGYMHFRGTRGIIAARNPWVDNCALKVQLTHAFGVDADAQELVVEKVYPERWISPRLFKSGESMSLPLGGYETAVYEVYPLREARRPLIAGVPFVATAANAQEYRISLYGKADELVLLNPGTVSTMTMEGRSTTMQQLLQVTESGRLPVPKNSVTLRPDSARRYADLEFSIDRSVRSATLAVLLTPANTDEKDTVVVTWEGVDSTTTLTRLDGEGNSVWYTRPAVTGKNAGRLRFTVRGGDGQWNGRATTYAICDQKQPQVDVVVTTGDEIVEPPLPRLALARAVVREHVRLGEVDLRATAE